MEVVLNAAIPSRPVFFTKFTTKTQKPSKSRTVSCSRKNKDLNGLFTSSSQIELEGHDNMEMPRERFNSSNTEPDVKHNDIWQLFREAQQNILYLNKQRLIALEELNETKREKQLLLDTIEQLKVEKQANTGKDKLPICSKLLLRIDSMVLTRVIGTAEASDLRRLLLDSIVSVADVFSGIMHKRDAELLAELRRFSAMSKKSGLHIVHICTEMEPLVSVRSLASYVTGLSRALQRKGNLVEVILPKYSSLELDEVQELREIEAEFYSYFDGQLHANKAWTGVVYGIGVTFIQPLNYSAFFSREKIYGYADDFERFTYFSRAALDYIVKSGKQPDVLHIHNWETAIVGPLFWDFFVKQGLEGTRILLTCHGFDSQGLEKPEKVALCGLDPSRLHRPDRLQDNIKTHLLNILKGGIVYSNKVVKVSPMHSKGKIVHSSSHGLESTLAIHKNKLLVAPYGFEYSTWDPSKEKFLPETFSADNMKGKAVCKVALQQHAGLSGHNSTVLVGCILSEISDVDLENLKKIIRIASRRGVQFIIMGISKIPSVNRALESFQEELKNENVRITKYEKGLFHLLFAGSDVILCQSLHDPVLQVSLKALKYGAAPIAVNINDDRFRHVIDHDSDSSKYTQYISTSFGNMSLSQALDEIENDPLHWNRKMADAMTKDFSWDAECSDIHISAYTSIKNH